MTKNKITVQKRPGRGAHGQYYLEYSSKSLKFPRNIFHAPKIKMVNKLASDLPVSATVLDAGCGAGYVSGGLPSKIKLTGVDIEKDAVEYCKKNYKGKFLQADLQKLPFEPNSFDLIIFCNTIEHLENPQLILKELKRVLKVQGKILVSTENTSNFLWLALERTWYPLFGGPCQPYRRDVHPQRYTPKSLMADLSKYFKIQSLETATLGMEIIAVATKLL